MSRSGNPFRYLEPSFFAGLLDDPVLLARVRPAGCNLLFDCGQLRHLAKRVLKQTRAIFISHAHMDHFMGIDSFIRSVLVAPHTFDIFGPPGLAEKLRHKLAGYDWNLAEDFWCRLRVQEVHEQRLVSWLLEGPRGFGCRPAGGQQRAERPIYANDFLQVEAALCNHGIPVLAYRCQERPAFAVDRERMARAGVVPGPWLEQLKRRFSEGFSDRRPLPVLRRAGGALVVRPQQDARLLYRRICRQAPPASIGYVTDVGYDAENVRRLEKLLQGVTLLVAECAFLREDAAKARRSYHFCTDDINRLLDRVRPALFLPMHLSKTYGGRWQQLYDQLDLPPRVTLLKLPEHLLGRPLLPCDVPRLHR